MDIIQSWTIVLYGTVSFLACLQGLYEVNKNKNSFGNTRLLFWLGIFVYGDAVVIGLFWSLASLVSVLLHDWILFWLFVAVFWVVRSLGETIYWLNQQYSPVIRNQPKDLVGYSLFKDESIWFVYQIVWQCITVIAVIMTIYLVRIWG